MERSRESWHRTSGKDGKLATTSSCSFVVLNRFVIDAKVSLKASRGRFPVAGLHLIGRRATPATRQPLLQRRSRHQRINTYCKIDPTANNTDRHTTCVSPTDRYKLTSESPLAKRTETTNFRPSPMKLPFHSFHLLAYSPVCLKTYYLYTLRVIIAFIVVLCTFMYKFVININMY